MFVLTSAARILKIVICWEHIISPWVISSACTYLGVKKHSVQPQEPWWVSSFAVSFANHPRQLQKGIQNPARTWDVSLLSGSHKQHSLEKHWLKHHLSPGP